MWRKKQRARRELQVQVQQESERERQALRVSRALCWSRRLELWAAIGVSGCFSVGLSERTFETMQTMKPFSSIL